MDISFLFVLQPISLLIHFLKEIATHETHFQLSLYYLIMKLF